MHADLTSPGDEARSGTRGLRVMTSDLQHRRSSSRVVWVLQVLMQMGPQLAAAASLPADISVESGRHGGLRSWTPAEALAEDVPPNHVPRSVRSPSWPGHRHHVTARVDGKVDVVVALRVCLRFCALHSSRF